MVVTHEEDPDFKDTDTRVDLNRRMRYLSLVMVTFWKRWRSEYLTALRERHAYDPGLGKPPSKVAVGDVVLIYDPDQPRTIWRMGKVETLFESADGAARGASLRVMSGSKSAVLRRPIQHSILWKVHLRCLILRGNQRLLLPVVTEWSQLLAAEDPTLLESPLS